jgi:hypothetical protein
MPIEDVDYLKQNSIKQNYTFLIDSKDRDYNAWPTPSEYTLTIDPPFPNVVGFQLLESTIPKTMYNVDVNNNKLVFYIHDTTIDITMIHTSNYTGADGSHTIDIGDYTIDTLIKALMGRINNDPTQPYLLEMHVNNDPNKPIAKITVESLSIPPDSKNTLKFSCPYPFVFDMQHTTIAESLGFDLYPQTATESQKLPLQQRYTSFVANYFYTSNNGLNYIAPINNPRLYHSVDLDPNVSLGSEYAIFTGPTGVTTPFTIGNIVVEIPTTYTSNISPASSNIIFTSNIIITSNITTSNVIPSSNITYDSNVISTIDIPKLTFLRPSLNITINSNITIASNITYISNILPASNITYTSNIVTTSNIVIILNIIPNTSNITFTSFTTISSNMLPESSSITTYSNIVLNSNIIYTSNIKSALHIKNTTSIFTTSNIVIISNIIPSTCNIITSLNTTFNSEILPIPGNVTNTTNIIINSNLTITSNIISALNITTTSNIINTSNISIIVNTMPPMSNITITSNLIITTNILPVDNTTITSNITINSNITLINTSNITPAVNKQGTSNQPTTEYNYAVQSFTVITNAYLTQLGAALSFNGTNNLIANEFAYWSLYTNYSDVIYNSSYASNFGIIPLQNPPVFSSSIDGLNDNYPYSLINISNLNFITNKYEILASSNAIGVTFTNGGYSFTNNQFQVKLLPGTYWIVMTSPTPGIGIYLNPTKYYTPYNPFISIQTPYFNPAISTLSNLWNYTTHNQPDNGIYYQASMQILLKNTYHYLIAPGIYSLIGERYVVVRCPQIETHSFRSLSYTKHSLGLGKVNLASIGYNQTTADFRSVDIRNFHPIGRLSKLTFRFETIAGNLYDFKGINHTLTCVVYYYEPISTKTFTQSILNPNYNGDYITYYNNTIDPEEDSDDENLPKYDYKNIENRHLPDSVQRIDQEALYRFSFDPDKE